MADVPPSLPAFVPPMQAQPGAVFDSERHVFEVLWDGFRAMTFIERTGYRVLGPQQEDFAPRYPELGFLSRLAPGAVLDGVLVLLRDGHPDHDALRHRDALRGDLHVQAASTSEPVALVVFDLLYEGFATLMDRPLHERRERLAALVGAVDHPGLVLSQGAIGGGSAFFQKIRQLGLPGMVAKDLTSLYEPGERSGAWTRVLDPKVLLCAVFGWQPDDHGQVATLLIATNEPEGLQPAGTLRAGLTDEVQARLRLFVDAHATDASFVPCDEPGSWVSPGLYAKVRARGRAPDGTLRDPELLDLVVDDGRSGD